MSVLEQWTMRYPKDHKEQTRRQIVEAAARAFRAEGVGEVSIAGLMQEAGLTHGGFYAHFPSKDALVAEACRHALAQSSKGLLDGAGGESGLFEVIDRYLGVRHRDTPATGCLLPALAGEMAREPAEVRRAFTEAFQAYVGRLAALLPAGADDEAADDALAVAAALSGAVALARAVDDPVLSDRVLAGTRALLLRAFADDCGAGLKDGAA